MADALANQAREALKVAVSPRYRRWRGIVRSLQLDPETLSQEEMRISGRDFLICGPPRSGTALLTAMLYQPSDVVTVMEPWDALRLSPKSLFRSLRDELERGIQIRGRLDLRALNEGKVGWCQDEEQSTPVDFGQESLLGVKFPGFWRYLSLMPDAKFVVCMRHPVELLASFAGTDGRLVQGLEYEAKFFDSFNLELLEATVDPAVRRAMFLEKVLAAVLPELHRENVYLVTYERWFSDRAGLLEELSEFLDTPLRDGPVVLAKRKATARDNETTLQLLRDYAPSSQEFGYSL